MIQMEQTMRWFGPGDAIKLEDLRQCGISGIVTALHEIPVGEIWTLEAIRNRQETIRNAGLEWTVVESLPIHEDIKKGLPTRDALIENYIESLQHLAACNIRVITYNFMPVLDWVRTEQSYRNSDGTRALLYNQWAFLYFDLFLLKRPGAASEFTAEEIEKAKAYGDSLHEEERETLFRNVLLGLPGSKENFTPEQVLQLLESYQNIDDSQLREHLIYFLSKIAPVATSLDLKLAIHPDDPPFSVLGLPRVVSSADDLSAIFSSVPQTANGLCYCTGSLGALPSNDLLEILDTHAHRIHFLHLRNVIRENEAVFRESEHLNGDNPMERIVERIIEIMQVRGSSLPMRPDHGFLHSAELQGEQYPGYSLIGRMKGLAELRGLEKGIIYKLKEN
ncbi:mannonate dehydratase [Robertkochia solimangrovi]|uniref:mannonate dehydratase n=1 Tax=Robertkochia solimangrovi TaxID=2213046 RepID=UPI00117EBE1C|nr:mannonate dehydratase [Robertkochia solimangrovi]TRZ42498.1 mannonate dehydratase [Robertkochia solimangrovi]